MGNLLTSTKFKKTVNYVDLDAISKLESFGLSYDDIRTAFIKANEEKRKKPKYAMPLEVNLTMLIESVKILRSLLLARGWAYEDKRNFNKTISPNGRFTLTISSGDEFVGNITVPCKTKNKKGVICEKIVEMNNIIQLNLDIPNFQTYKLKYNPKLALNWFLMFHHTKNSIKLELSLPALYDLKTKKVISWYERIILPEIRLQDIIVNINDVDAPLKPLCDNILEDINITKK